MFATLQDSLTFYFLLVTFLFPFLTFFLPFLLSDMFEDLSDVFDELFDLHGYAFILYAFILYTVILGGLLYRVETVAKRAPNPIPSHQTQSETPSELVPTPQMPRHARDESGDSQQLQQEHEQEIEQEVQRTIQRLEQKRQEEIQQLQQGHQQDIQQLQQGHEQEIQQKMLQKIQQLEHEKQKHQQEIRQLQQGHQQEIQKLEQKIQKLEDDKQRLESAVVAERKNADRISVKSQKDSEQAKKASEFSKKDHKNQLNELEHRFGAGLSKTVNMLENVIVERTKQRDAALSDIASLTSNRQHELNTDSLIRCHERETASLAEKHREKIAQKEAKITELIGEIAGKDAKITELIGEIAGKDAKITQLTGEKADQDAKLADQDAEITQLKREKACIVEKQVETELQRDEADKQSRQAQKAHEETKANLAEAHVAVDNLKLQNRNKLVKKPRKVSPSQQKEINRLHEDLTVKIQELVQTRKKLRQIEQEFDQDRQKLQQKVKEQRRQANRLRQEIRDSDITESTSPWSRGLGLLGTPYRARDRALRLLFLNEECTVNQVAEIYAGGLQIDMAEICAGDLDIDMVEIDSDEDLEMAEDEYDAGHCPYGCPDTTQTSRVQLMNGQLKSYLDQLKPRYVQEKSNNKQLKHRCQRLESDIARVRTDSVADEQKPQEEFEASKRDSAAEKQKHQEEIDALNKEHNLNRQKLVKGFKAELKKVRVKRQEDLKAARAETSKVEAEKAELQSQLAKSQEENETSKGQLSKLQGENAELHSQLVSSQSVPPQMGAENSQPSVEGVDLQERARRAEEKSSAGTSAAKQQMHTSQRNVGELNLKREIRRLVKKGRKDAKFKATKDSFVRLKAECAKKEQQTKYEIALKDMKTQLDVARDMNVKLEGQKDQLQSELEVSNGPQLLQELEFGRNKLSQKDQELMQKDLEIVRKTQELTQKDQELTKVQSALTDLEKNYQLACDTVLKLQVENDRQHEELQFSRNKLFEKDQEITKAQAVIDDLKSQLDALKKMKMDMSTDHSVDSHKMEVLEQKIMELEETVDNLNCDVEMKDKACDLLREELRMAQGTINNLEARLEMDEAAGNQLAAELGQAVAQDSSPQMSMELEQSNKTIKEFLYLINHLRKWTKEIAESYNDLVEAVRQRDNQRLSILLTDQTCSNNIGTLQVMWRGYQRTYPLDPW